MTSRTTPPPGPDVMGAIQSLQKAIQSGGVEPTTLELVHLRTSQINGCSACVHAGIASAKRAGETDERLHQVVAWRETRIFTGAERVALAFAEAATRIQDGGDGVTDALWDELTDHYDENGVSALILEVALTNFFNRINHATREQAGRVW